MNLQPHGEESKLLWHVALLESLSRRFAVKIFAVKMFAVFSFLFGIGSVLFEKALSPSRSEGVFVPDLSDKSGPGVVDFCLVDFRESTSVCNHQRRP